MEQGGNCWQSLFDIIMKNDPSLNESIKTHTEVYSMSLSQGKPSIYKEITENIDDLNHFGHNFLLACSKVFKFHLQPVEGKVIDYLTILINIYNEDNEFRNAVRCIKVVEDYDRLVINKSPSFPVLVIYPRCDENDLIEGGIPSWRIILDKLRLN